MTEIEKKEYQRRLWLIYKEACKCVKNTHGNQFLSASVFARKAIEEVCLDDDHYEIGSYYTKKGAPVVVWFE